MWAEPSMLADSAWEFADMGKFVDVAERLIGPYDFGDYAVIVLPKSFPYGGALDLPVNPALPHGTFLTRKGMENTNLSKQTSLASL